MGTAYSVLFVSTQASAEPGQASAAVSTLLLSSAMGIIIGIACLSAAMKEMLRKSLEAKLGSLGLDAATRLDVRFLIKLRWLSNELTRLGRLFPKPSRASNTRTKLKERLVRLSCHPMFMDCYTHMVLRCSLWLRVSPWHCF